MNIDAVVERQVRVEVMIDNLTTAVQQIYTNQPTADKSVVVASTKVMIVDMKCTLEAFTKTVDARLDHLTSVCRTTMSSIIINAIRSERCTR